jgi:hypothetical protein
MTKTNHLVRAFQFLPMLVSSAVVKAFGFNHGDHEVTSVPPVFEERDCARARAHTQESRLLIHGKVKEG